MEQRTGISDFDLVARLQISTPNLLKAFNDFQGRIMSPGTLDIKTKELIALAVAHVIGSQSGIIKYTLEASKAGANEIELLEAIFTASAVYARAIIDHSTAIFEALNSSKPEDLSLSPGEESQEFAINSK